MVRRLYQIPSRLQNLTVPCRPDALPSEEDSDDAAAVADSNEEAHSAAVAAATTDAVGSVDGFRYIGSGCSGSNSSDSNCWRPSCSPYSAD